MRLEAKFSRIQLTDGLEDTPLALPKQMRATHEQADRFVMLIWRRSEAFCERFEQASLIIAKGQANYETLSTTPAPICVLLQTKCPVIAGDLGVDQGGIVVKAAETPTPERVA